MGRPPWHQYTHSSLGTEIAETQHAHARYVRPSAPFAVSNARSASEADRHHAILVITVRLAGAPGRVLGAVAHSVLAAACRPFFAGFGTACSSGSSSFSSLPPAAITAPDRPRFARIFATSSFAIAGFS